MGQAHPREMLAAFQSGETALVYARNKSDGTLFFLEDGTATRDGLREWVAEELECFLPDCGDRRLRLVNRHSSVRTARDGFRHLAGAACNPTAESLFHQQSKAAVVAWVLANRPGLVAEAEVDLTVRRPDVLITGSDGRRLGVEFQYSALTVANLEERTTSYGELDAAVTWMFGHTGKQFRVDTSTYVGGTFVRLTDVQLAVLRSGGNVVWLNPVANLIATPYVRRTLLSGRGSWDTPPTAGADWVQIVIEPFDSAVALDPERGFITRAQAQLERERLRFEEAKARLDAARAQQKQQQQQQNAHAQRLAAYRARQAEKVRRRVAGQQAKAERRAAEAARRESEWMTPERKARLEAVLTSNRQSWAGRAGVTRPPSTKPRCRACGEPLDEI